MSPLPEFYTSRLILRGVTEADAPSYQKHFNNYAIISQLSRGVPWPFPENGALTFIQERILPKQGKDKWVWGIFLKEHPQELIGAVDLWREGKPEHRGFWLSEAHWGKGIMTEAVAPVMDYAFCDLGFDVLIFSNARGNEKSRRIKEKTGARLLRTEPAEFVDPTYTEHEIWELTKEEWQKVKAQSGSSA